MRFLTLLKSFINIAPCPVGFHILNKHSVKRKQFCKCCERQTDGDPLGNEGCFVFRRAFWACVTVLAPSLIRRKKRSSLINDSSLVVPPKVSRVMRGVEGHYWIPQPLDKKGIACPKIRPSRTKYIFTHMHMHMHACVPHSISSFHRNPQESTIKSFLTAEVCYNLLWNPLLTATWFPGLCNGVSDGHALPL